MNAITFSIIGLCGMGACLAAPAPARVDDAQLRLAEQIERNEASAERYMIHWRETIRITDGARSEDLMGHNYKYWKMNGRFCTAVETWDDQYVPPRKGECLTEQELHNLPFQFAEFVRERSGQWSKSGGVSVLRIAAAHPTPGQPYREACMNSMSMEVELAPGAETPRTMTIRIEDKGCDRMFDDGSRSNHQPGFQAVYKMEQQPDGFNATVSVQTSGPSVYPVLVGKSVHGRRLNLSRPIQNARSESLYTLLKIERLEEAVVPDVTPSCLTAQTRGGNSCGSK